MPIQEHKSNKPPALYMDLRIGRHRMPVQMIEGKTVYLTEPMPANVANTGRSEPVELRLQLNDVLHLFEGTLASVGNSRDTVSISWHGATPLDVLPARDDSESVIAALRKEVAYLRALHDLLGHVQNGSSDTVTIWQDDATMDYMIGVGHEPHRRTFYAKSFYGVLEKVQEHIQNQKEEAQHG